MTIASNIRAGLLARPLIAPLTLLPASWFDASDPATLTLDGSNGVQVWSDKSGNARHNRTLSADRRITYAAADARIGGRPSLSPVDATRVMTIQSDLGQLLAFDLREVYVVAQHGDGTTTSFTIANGLPAESPAIGGIAGARDGYQALFGGAPAGNPRIMGLVNTAYYIQTNAFTNVAYRNRETTGKGNSAAAPILPMPLSVQRFTINTSTVNVGRFFFNQDNNSRRAWNGPVCEIIGFSQALAATDRDRLVDYLMAKWSLN